MSGATTPTPAPGVGGGLSTHCSAAPISSSAPAAWAGSLVSAVSAPGGGLIAAMTAPAASEATASTLRFFIPGSTPRRPKGHGLITEITAADGFASRSEARAHGAYAVRMLVYAPAALLFLVFCVRVVRERRKFSNAVILGLAMLCALAAWVFQLVRSGSASGQAVGWALVVLGGLGILVLTCLLVLNGLQMVRKEGRSPTNLLSLLAALCILAVVGLVVTAVVVRTPVWVGVGAAAGGLAAYLSFLFLCFVVYAFLYGRLRVRRKADYVVVLGSGLVGGSTVPPLLASRLKRAQAVHARLAKRGGSPVIITSGGQGPDEDVPESHAMADYLIERGVPADLIEREDRSTTTDENLRFSRAIMEKSKPDYRCVVVTNNYHAFRAALTARRTGIRGQVVGSPTAAYFWPTATIREFTAVLVAYKRANAAICLLLVLGGVLAWWARQSASG